MGGAGAQGLMSGRHCPLPPLEYCVRILPYKEMRITTHGLLLLQVSLSVCVRVIKDSLGSGSVPILYLYSVLRCPLHGGLILFPHKCFLSGPPASPAGSPGGRGAGGPGPGPGPPAVNFPYPTK